MAQPYGDSTARNQMIIIKKIDLMVFPAMKY